VDKKRIRKEKKMKTFSELLAKSGRKKPVVFAFGRLNPPTIGHQKLIDRVITMAKRVKGKPVLYVSASQDKTKNPLTVKQKIDYIKKIYSRGIDILPATGRERTFMEILKNRFDKKYTEVYMVAGSDRVLEFKKLIKTYNGKDYNFDVVEVISAGSRDPDAEGVSGASGTKMREFARNNDYKSFKQNLMTGTRENVAMKLFKDLKKQMGVNESMAPEDESMRMIRENYHNNEIFNIGDLVENVRNNNVGKVIKRGPNYIQYEMEDGGVEKAWLDDVVPANNFDDELQAEAVDQKKLVLQKNSKQLKTFSSFEEEINSAKDAQQDVGKDKAKEKEAAKKKERKLNVKTPGQPSIKNVDDWTQGPENADQIKTMRTFNISTPGQVRDYGTFVQNRKFQKFESVNEKKKEIEIDEKNHDDERKKSASGGQDPDIKDRPGTQPKKYYDKPGKGDFAKSTKQARARHFEKGAKKDDDDPSAYKPAPGDKGAETKPSKFTKKFKKMFGEDQEQEIKDIKTWSESKDTIEQYKDEYGTEYRVHLDKTVSEMLDEVLSENEGVKKKAAKSGMPYGVLMKVYNRGMAAWRTGHRPGTTPQQWGMARVNSFVTKSKGTWGGADKDLAAKVRK
tara:strand:+ start:561 stop:2426 length:1866 start_codon:yes stop_codon:yes gene_type:complete